MKRLIFIVTALFLTGCATAHQERTATRGAAIGATAGAVIGSQSDQVLEGAIIGGVLGGLAGAILSEDRDDRVHSSERRYHRSACERGDIYFGRARNSRSLDRRIAFMRQGIRYCPNNPAAHNDLGVALMLWGDSAGARIHFNQALRFDPHYYPSQRNLKRMKRYRSPHVRIEHRRDHRNKDYRRDHNSSDRDHYRQDNRSRDWKKDRQQRERSDWKKKNHRNEGYQKPHHDTRQQPKQRDRGKYRDQRERGDDDKKHRRDRDRHDDD